MTVSTREVPLEVAYNVRHLGGYITIDGLRTTDDLIRSASLHRLTPAGLEALAGRGIRTIIDFRSTMERERDVSPDVTAFGAHVVHATVFETDASPVGLEEGFPGYATVYERMLEAGMPAYRKFAETIADSDGGVLFHCAAGKDRTGIAAALLLEVAGVDDRQIIDDYRVSAELLSPVLKEWLPRMAERGITEEQALLLMASDEADMASALAHIAERWGSAEGYLVATGVSAAAIDRLRARMVA